MSVKLLDRLKRVQEVAALRRRARRNPSPPAYAALCDRCVAVGRLDTALEAAEEGLRRFPDSDRLQQVRTFVLRKQNGSEIRRLRQIVSRRPTEGAFTELVELYRSLGGDEDALAVARRAVEQFPRCERAHVLAAEIRLERFLVGRVAQDAVEADSALAAVLALNPNHVKAHVLSAQLRHLLGDVADVRRHVQTTLAAMPGADVLVAFVNGLPDDYEAQPRNAARLARSVEREDAFARPPHEFPALPGYTAPLDGVDTVEADVENLARAVVELAELPGVLNAALVDSEGTPVAESSSSSPRRPREPLTPAAFASVTHSVELLADAATKRLDLGRLVCAEIEGHDGNLTVVRVGDVSGALFWSDPMRAEQASAVLAECRARHLVRAGDGVSRA